MFAQTHIIARQRLWLHGAALHKALQLAQFKQYPLDQIEYFQSQLDVARRCLTASVLCGGNHASK